MSHPDTFPLLKGLTSSWVENYSIKYSSDFKRFVPPAPDLYAFFFFKEQCYSSYFLLSFLPYFCPLEYLTNFLEDLGSPKLYFQTFTIL